MRSIWSFAPKVNLAAPGAIGGTTAGSGAFATLTASSTLAVTAGTTLTGGLTLPGGANLVKVNNSLSYYNGSATLTLGNNGPSSLIDGPGPIYWIRIYDDYFGRPLYFPVWGQEPL